MNMTKEDRQGVIYIFIAMSIATVLVYLAISVNKKNKYDEVTLCPLEIPYETTVVIIDKSDKWGDADSLHIKNLLKAVSRKLQKFERLIIKVIEPTENANITVKTYFDMCNPGAKANPFYENPRRILKKYTQFFKEPLEELLQMLARPEVSKSTPLLSVIRDTLVENTGKINLVIVSDFMEYSKEYDFYKHIPSQSEIYKKLDMPTDKLKSLQAEYIMRQRIRKKINDAITFYKNLTYRLGGTFSQKQIITMEN